MISVLRLSITEIDIITFCFNNNRIVSYDCACKLSTKCMVKLWYDGMDYDLNNGHIYSACQRNLLTIC